LIQITYFRNKIVIKGRIKPQRIYFSFLFSHKIRKCVTGQPHYNLSDRLKMSVGAELPSTGLKHTSGDAIRARSLTCVDPAQRSPHTCGGEGERLVVCRGHSYDGRLLVIPVKASLEVVLLIRKGGVAGWLRGVGGFVVRNGLDALPHASGVGDVVEVLLKP